ncbi:aldo/keto reductase [Lihuaxuella thermophila]|uniref:Predicted oxidoreductase n=1 Tax=Lihuaxuella thermophila TaxID=1173111 RepID=A0A1H8IUR1_9BACL|nr:aldo/keto reductase [Lihuaxuella thermophila]SEN72089.1 Predicted oxidoreductase [Lihuaxuella thermophila]
METVKLASDLSFSRIILGLMRLNQWGFDETELIRFTEQCLEQGITTFDLADIYGDYTCESIFGQVLKQKPILRDRMQIVTKCGICMRSDKYPDRRVKYYDTSKEHILASVDNSLRHLQTDYIDLLLIHRPDPMIDPEEVAEAFAHLKKVGKVRHFGVSNFTPSQFRMISAYVEMPLVTNQIEMSVLHVEPFFDGTMDQCLEKRIPPMAWSPLAGGRIFSAADEQSLRTREALVQVGKELGDFSLDQLMLAWLLRHPGRIMPIIGTGRWDRILSAVQSLAIPMTRMQWFQILEASRGRQVD